MYTADQGTSSVCSYEVPMFVTVVTQVFLEPHMEIIQTSLWVLNFSSLKAQFMIPARLAAKFLGRKFPVSFESNIWVHCVVPRPVLES